MLKTSSSWKEQLDSFNEFLWNPKRRCRVFIVDCDAPLEYKHLDCARFRKMGRSTAPSSQTEVSNDPLIERDEPAGVSELRNDSQICVARNHWEALDTSSRQGPIKRLLVSIPCPGRDCESQRSHEWSCFNCDTLIEFSSTDDYIYCNCGRALYNKWRFKCGGESHGNEFDKYPPKDLHKLLQRLYQPVHRNILVLGETGVGKSTFINAFHNYLKFESFDEAKARSARKLEYVIPCHFYMRRASPSTPYDSESRVIRVGSRDGERDGSSGDSATQKTSVYTMTYKNTDYRLIDTPGIGDTRGPEQDKENLRGILNVLSNYEELHGILILLNTSQTRITATFEFCFEELLSHLHRDAVLNISFGFTYAMASGYEPGDCFPILKRKLREYADVDLDLDRQRAYSFDAESFRCLAALYRGFQGNDDRRSRESWDRSRAEALRFLEHVDSLKPHDVGQTLSMDGARRAVEQLLIPMVQVSQEIKQNITLLGDKLKELQNTRLKGDRLRKKLHLERIEFRAEKLDKPRTVVSTVNAVNLERTQMGRLLLTISRSAIATADFQTSPKTV